MKKKLTCKKTNKPIEMMDFEQLRKCINCDDGGVGCEAMRIIFKSPAVRRQGVVSGK